MKHHRLSPHARLAAVFVPTVIALAACGGSDDPAAPPAPAGPALTLTGTAATGAAIAGGTVDAKCNGGNGNATTAADGSYTIALEQGALPCLLRVTSGATVLHSVVQGTGASAHANLTPISELVVARLAGGDPAAFYGAFNPASVPATAQVQAAVAAVTTLLKDAGVDLSGVDVLGGSLVAANGNSAGNAFDQALDALKTKLAGAGVTLAELRDAAAGSIPPAAAMNATPSLPAELKLRSAAPNCAALRSGKFRLVFFAPGENGGVFTDTMTLDAPTLKVTLADGEVSDLVAAGECQYTVASGGELVVSPAGIGVFRSNERPGYIAAMAIPEQQHPVSVTAGTWNYVGLGDTDGRFGTPHLYRGEMTVDAEGRMTRGVFCDDLKTCVDEGPDPAFVFTANAQGGFNFDGSRVFAYRSGGGELVLVSVDSDGSFSLATRKAPRPLPTLGGLNRSWNLTVTPQYSSPNALSLSENTTVSHASDGASYLRNAVIDFATRVTRPETVQLDTPAEGFIRRVPETVTTSTGGSSNVGEWIAMTLRGTGITPVAIVTNNQMVLSVTKPAQP